MLMQSTASLVTSLFRSVCVHYSIIFSTAKTSENLTSPLNLQQ